MVHGPNFDEIPPKPQCSNVEKRKQKVGREIRTPLPLSREVALLIQKNHVIKLHYLHLHLSFI